MISLYLLGLIMSIMLTYNGVPVLLSPKQHVLSAWRGKTRNARRVLRTLGAAKLARSFRPHTDQGYLTTSPGSLQLFDDFGERGDNLVTVDA